MAQRHRDVLIGLRYRALTFGCAWTLFCLNAPLRAEESPSQPTTPEESPSQPTTPEESAPLPSPESSVPASSSTQRPDLPTGKKSVPSIEESALVILAVMTPTGEMPSPTGLRRPSLAAEESLWNKARELDGLLRDTAQDLGFVVDLPGAQNTTPASTSEQALIARAHTSSKWFLSPRIELAGNSIVLRFVLIPAGSEHALVRTETVQAEDFQVRAVVMFRDLVRAAQQRPMLSRRAAKKTPITHEMKRQRSEGRAVLAAHSAAFGGFVGYSLQKSSGSDDARLTYPLMALGTGLGLGGSLIVAEEWNVGLGDAWYMSAGAFWPTFGGLMLARGHDIQPVSDRYPWGMGAGLAGITLASFSLSFAGMSDGGAAVAHSGGLMGAGLGAGIQRTIVGKNDETPFQGLGYGALGGVLLGGVIGRFVEESPSRIMMIDVGIGLGALSFAAVSSPLLFKNTTENRERAWTLLTMSGAIAGGITTYFMTSPQDSSTSKHAFPVPGYPVAGVIGQSQTPDGQSAPAYGIGWTGDF